MLYYCGFIKTFTYRRKIKVFYIIYKNRGVKIIAQELVKHDGIIHKIYNIGEFFCQMQKPSIPNINVLDMDEELKNRPWFFDS